jgi:hypothetical protein
VAEEIAVDDMEATKTAAEEEVGKDVEDESVRRVAEADKEEGDEVEEESVRTTRVDKED